MTRRNNWVTADLDGLAALVEDRPRVFVLFELLSNALDEDTRLVEITLSAIPGEPLARLVVADDNPTGFADLTHAWRLFASSKKKDTADTRGRFNMGEKLVLSLCEEARISTTTGTVLFDSAGRRVEPDVRMVAGSRFEAVIRMTAAQISEALEQVRWALVPPGVTVLVNGEVLMPRAPLQAFEATLPTVIGDEAGVLRRSRRKATVEIFEPRSGETAMLYELGIPLFPTGDAYHVNVCQKVPLNTDRDNVTPGFLREVRAAVLSNTYTLLDREAATSEWVNEALAHKSISAEAIQGVVRHRFGTQVVVNDPSDREATQRAVSQGYSVVYGGSFNAAQWQNIRAANVLAPAGRIFPTPLPHAPGTDPQTRGEIPQHDWPEAIREVVALTHRLAARLLGVEIRIFVVDRQDERFNAWYGGREFTYNVAWLGLAFFEDWQKPGGREKVLDLIIHELAHEYESSHLDAKYHRATTWLGARLTIVALTAPELFQPVAHRPAAGGDDTPACDDDGDLGAALDSLDGSSQPPSADDGGIWKPSGRGEGVAAAAHTRANRQSMKASTPRRAVELLLAALADRRWDDVIDLIRPEAAIQIIEEAKTTLRYRVSRDYTSLDPEDNADAQRERRAKALAEWGITDPDELEKMSLREVFARHLVAEGWYPEADPFSQRDWRVLGVVRQNAYSAYVVFEKRATGSFCRWPDSYPMGTHLVRVQRLSGEWKVELDREFLEKYHSYRHHRRRSCGYFMDTANTYLVARVWSEVAREAALDASEREDVAHASTHRGLRAAAEHLESVSDWVFVDPGAAKAELLSAFDDDERDVVWALLEDSSAFGPVTADGLSEVLVAEMVSYAARIEAFYLLGIPIPTREGPAMLADVVARQVSRAMRKWVTEDVLGPPGPRRLERALAEVVGSSPLERAAVGIAVPEIYEVLWKVRERRPTR